MAAPLHHKRNFYRYFYRAGAFETLARLRPYMNSRSANAVARSLSKIYTATHADILEVVRDNLSLLLAEPAPRRSAARVFENFATMLADFFAVHHLPPSQAAQNCLQRTGEDALQEAQRHGKGAILATAHFGFFELGAALLADLGMPLTVLTMPESNGAMTAWRAQFRARWGTSSITVGSDTFSSLEVVRALNQGRFVAMLVDRPLKPHTLTVETPGGRTSFSLAAALLANLANCPIIPVAIWKSNHTYRMNTHEAIWVRSAPPSATRRLALEEATYKIAQSLLQDLIQAPEQWYQFVSVRV